MSKSSLLSLSSAVTLSFALSVLLLPSSSSAHAAYALINLNTVVNYDYGANTSVDTSAAPDVKVKAVKSDTTSVKVPAASSTSSASVNSNAEAKDSSFQNGETTGVTRKEADAYSTGSSSTTVVIAPKAVTNAADLQAYAMGELRSDPMVEEMNFTDKAVEVRYREGGHLLALIPITFTIKVVAHSDGSVDVKYPWYSVLTVDKRDQIEAGVKIAVENAMSAHLLGSVKAAGVGVHLFSTSEAAEVAAQIHATLKATLSDSGYTEGK